jgi:hypothetical protein
MSNCSICGTVEYWTAPNQGAMATPYCPDCNPPATVVLPLDVGRDFDIDESEIHGMPPDPVSGATNATGPAGPAMSFGNDPNSGIINSNDIGFSVGGASSLSIQGDGDAPLEMNGEQVLTTYDEWPENAEQGTIGFKKGVSGAHVFDGEEWQNLGEALLGKKQDMEAKKRNVVTPENAKCDRRGAIAATKAKDAE